MDNKGPCILYFTGASCPSCAAQSRAMSHLDFTIQQAIQKVDVDANPGMAEIYEVMSLPTTMIMDADGEVKHINYGVASTMKLAEQWKSVKG